MCGIAGVLHSDGSAVDVDRIKQASLAIAHRGPDDEGYLGWRGGQEALCTRAIEQLNGSSCILAHRRLSILDTSPAGWQPMGTPDGKQFITFNGEIYNFLELRSQLRKEGVTFHSKSDTEVLLHALSRWGVDALRRLTGMFAFAYLDLTSNRLVLARDFFGIKPLYYTYSQGVLGFASEIKSLLAMLNVSREVNPRELYNYLRYGIIDASPDTLFSSVHRLPPGHILSMPLDGQRPPDITPYWKLNTNETCDLSYSDATARMRELFLESVDLHLRSDVQVGAALSGGVDSTAIVMAMRQLRGPDLDLHTFSYIAENDDISEERWIDTAAQAAGAVSHKVHPTAHDFIRDLDTFIAANDEPFGWYNGYAQHRVFELSKQQGIKVSLDGQGADELLCGYDFFVQIRVRALLRKGRFMEAYRLLSHIDAQEHVSASSFIRTAARTLLPESVKRAIRGGRQPSAVPFFNYAWFEKHGALTGDKQAKPPTQMRDALYETFVESSLPRLLRCEDRNSMAHSIESRVPFLSPDLVRFVYTLPEHYLVSREGVTKAVFRSAMKGIVPDAILNRKDKMGCPTPNWLHQNAKQVGAMLKEGQAMGLPALHGETLSSCFEGTLESKSGSYRPIWRALNLQRWAKIYGATFPQ